MLKNKKILSFQAHLIRVIKFKLPRKRKTRESVSFLFQLSVPCGTISTPSVREVCFASEVPAGVSGTLNFTLCESTKLHYANGITSHRLCRCFAQTLAPPPLLCYNIQKEVIR